MSEQDLEHTKELLAAARAELVAQTGRAVAAELIMGYRRERIEKARAELASVLSPPWWSQVMMPMGMADALQRAYAALDTQEETL